MRFICYSDYVLYITEHPSCSVEDLKRGTMMGQRIEDNLLEVLKISLGCSYGVSTPSLGYRDIVVTK